jgi:hypothetical protein
MKMPFGLKVSKREIAKEVHEADRAGHEANVAGLFKTVAQEQKHHRRNRIVRARCDRQCSEFLEKSNSFQTDGRRRSFSYDLETTEERGTQVGLTNAMEQKVGVFCR